MYPGLLSGLFQRLHGTMKSVCTAVKHEGPLPTVSQHRLPTSVIQFSIITSVDGASQRVLGSDSVLFNFVERPLKDSHLVSLIFPHCIKGISLELFI